MLISVQALRALAAWTVVCHHFMQIFFDFKARGPVGSSSLIKAQSVSMSSSSSAGW